MRKKPILVLGLMALLPALVLILLRPFGGMPLSPVSAARLDSSFTSGYNISNSPSYAGSQHPRIARAADGFLHVVWMEGIPDVSNGPAYIRGQETTWPSWEWAGPQNNPGYTNPALLVASDGTVHAVWAGGGGSPYDIFYAYKPSAGAWSGPVNISNSAYNTVYPSIGIESTGRLWVAYQSSLADTNNEIFVVNKPAGGAWSTPVKLSPSGKDDLSVSLVVDKNDVVHVVWRNNDVNWEIYYTRYQGGSWTSPVNISGTSSASHFPRIATDSTGRLFVVWEDEIDGTDRFQALFKRSNDGGVNWSTYVRVSNSTKALYPAVHADDACNLYATWQDYRDGPTETYFSHSTDCGATWLGDENVSRNGSNSYFPDIVSQPGGFAHIVWQDMAPGQLDIYYSKATISMPPPPTTPAPTSPTNTPTPTPTNTPTPTPDPRPHGFVDIIAQAPPYDTLHTSQLTTTLDISATSDVGANVTSMWVCNLGQCSPTPQWIPFAEAFANWTLLDDGYACGYKWVYTTFLDDRGQQSPTYSDYIQYDSFLTASMSINNGSGWTNQTLVTVNSVDRDGQVQDCTGLRDMRLREETGITYTTWISYHPAVYFFLASNGPPSRTVDAEYRDYAGNTGLFSDSISFDINPPYSGTPPTLNSTTTELIITVSGLLAYDDESGVARVWLANRPNGPWLPLNYCASPPCSYEWNLAYGGPPIVLPDLHRVYVKYEDAAGWGSVPGNFSAVYSSTIAISGISNAFLPLLDRGFHAGLGARAPVAPAEADLILLSDRQEARAGQDVLLYLAVVRGQSTPLEGTLQLLLPEGLRVVRAWSAYGTLLQASDRAITSRERAWDRQTAWILVQARVEPGASALLQVEGTMSWDGGALTAVPLQIENR